MASGLENIETIESPFRRFVTTIGVFPTAFTDAMTYYECLAYLVKYLEETVIPAVNENAEALEELQTLYVELKSYVDNYFANLDVQEEINNKLDAMAESGELQDILNDYFKGEFEKLDVKIDAEAETRQNADNTLATQIQNTNTNLQAEISALASGSPIAVTSTSEMTDTTKVYVNTTDGKWYYYDGDSWEIGGTYQSTGIDPEDPVIAGKLDKQQILEQSAYTRNSGWISTSNTVFASPSGQHYEHCILSVNAGEKYVISGYSVNNQYPGARITKGGYGTYTIEQGSAVQFRDVEVTVPDGYDGATMYVNGWVEKQSADIEGYVTQSSEDYWEEFTDLKAEVENTHKQLSARRDGNNIYFFRHNYTDGVDLTIWFKRKAMNSLMDFFGWFTSANTSDSVITSLPEATARTQITAGDTDWLAPSVVYAANNGGGDFDDFTSNKFTGGWHGYNNSTVSGTPTAREISLSLYVDDNLVTDGNYGVGDNIKLVIVNNLQGSNTEKSDGSGREIVQQTFIITMNKDSNKVTVESEVKALEDVIFERHYGLSMYRSNQSDNGYFINSHTYHIPFVYSANVTNSGKETTGCTEIMVAKNATIEMNRDNTYGLGDGYAIKNNYGVLVTGGKAYNQMINCIGLNVQTQGFALNQNGIVRWRGYYDVNHE